MQESKQIIVKRMAHMIYVFTKKIKRKKEKKYLKSYNAYHINES